VVFEALIRARRRADAIRVLFFYELHTYRQGADAISAADFISIAQDLAESGSNTRRVLNVFFHDFGPIPISVGRRQIQIGE
jgi:hypothetical protein